MSTKAEQLVEAYIHGQVSESRSMPRGLVLSKWKLTKLDDEIMKLIKKYSPGNDPRVYDDASNLRVEDEVIYNVEFQYEWDPTLANLSPDIINHLTNEMIRLGKRYGVDLSNFDAEQLTFYANLEAPGGYWDGW